MGPNRALVGDTVEESTRCAAAGHPLRVPLAMGRRRDLLVRGPPSVDAADPWMVAHACLIFHNGGRC